MLYSYHLIGLTLPFSPTISLCYILTSDSTSTYYILSLLLFFYLVLQILHHSVSLCQYYFYTINKITKMFLERRKRASPGIEPGPPAPKAGILPLNYKAFLLLYSYFSCSDHHTNISQLYLLLKKGALAGIEPAPPAP